MRLPIQKGTRTTYLPSCFWIWIALRRLTTALDNRLPINTLKIDRAFINGLNVDIEKMDIIRTIVALACSLDMDVIAEGVETCQQMYQLKALKCDFGQGYLFSKLLDSDMAAALIEVSIRT